LLLLAIQSEWVYCYWLNGRTGQLESPCVCWVGSMNILCLLLLMNVQRVVLEWGEMFEWVGFDFFPTSFFFNFCSHSLLFLEFVSFWLPCVFYFFSFNQKRLSGVKLCLVVRFRSNFQYQFYYFVLIQSLLLLVVFFLILVLPADFIWSIGLLPVLHRYFFLTYNHFLIKFLFSKNCRDLIFLSL